MGHVEGEEEEEEGEEEGYNHLPSSCRLKSYNLLL